MDIGGRSTELITNPKYWLLSWRNDQSSNVRWQFGKPFFTLPTCLAWSFDSCGSGRGNGLFLLAWCHWEMSPSLCCNIGHFLFIFGFPKELLNQSGTSKGYLVALSFETHCTIYSFLKTDTGSRNTPFPIHFQKQRVYCLEEKHFHGLLPWSQ